MNNHVIKERFLRDRQIIFFLLSTFLGAAATGIFFGSLNNFLSDIYNISASSRGFIETIRELPGALLILLLAPLSNIGERSILIAATCLIAVGIWGAATLAPGVIAVTFWLFVWSVGAHVVMTIRESFSVALSTPVTRGKIFGIVRSLRSFGTIVGAIIIWIGMDHFGFGYDELYYLAAVITLVSAVSVFFLKDQAHTAIHRKKFVFKKKYSLFYMLAILFGVRKQIFLVFGPWVLIRIYNQSAPQMAKLLIISSAVGIALKPILGRMIDKFGEKVVLSFDAISLMIICGFYGLANKILPAYLVIPSLYACYILDDSLFFLRSAHVTYLSKIVEGAEELTACISTSFSLEHVVSMMAPAIAGIIWVKYGYPWVFFICAIVALFMFITARLIPSKKQLEELNSGL